MEGLSIQHSRKILVFQYGISQRVIFTYFRLNNADCSYPGPVEAVTHQFPTMDLHRTNTCRCLHLIHSTWPLSLYLYIHVCVYLCVYMHACMNATGHVFVCVRILSTINGLMGSLGFLFANFFLFMLRKYNKLYNFMFSFMFSNIEYNM